MDNLREMGITAAVGTVITCRARKCELARSRRKLGKGTGGAREEVPCPEAMLRYNPIYKCVDQFDFLLTGTWDNEGRTIFHKWYCCWALGASSPRSCSRSNTFDGTPWLRGMAVPSIGKGRAGRHSGTHGVGSLLRDLNLPASHSGMVCVVCRGARTRTWCKECDLAMTVLDRHACRLLSQLDFHNPLIASFPTYRHGPRGQDGSFWTILRGALATVNAVTTRCHGTHAGKGCPRVASIAASPSSWRPAAASCRIVPHKWRHHAVHRVVGRVINGKLAGLDQADLTQSNHFLKSSDSTSTARAMSLCQQISMYHAPTCHPSVQLGIAATQQGRYSVSSLDRSLAWGSQDHGTGGDAAGKEIRIYSYALLAKVNAYGKGEEARYQIKGVTECRKKGDSRGGNQGRNKQCNKDCGKATSEQKGQFLLSSPQTYSKFKQGISKPRKELRSMSRELSDIVFSGAMGICNGGIRAEPYCSKLACVRVQHKLAAKFEPRPLQFWRGASQQLSGMAVFMRNLTTSTKRATWNTSVSQRRRHPKLCPKCGGVFCRLLTANAKLLYAARTPALLAGRHVAERAGFLQVWQKPPAGSCRIQQWAVERKGGRVDAEATRHHISQQDVPSASNRPLGSYIASVSESMAPERCCLSPSPPCHDPMTEGCFGCFSTDLMGGPWGPRDTGRSLFHNHPETRPIGSMSLLERLRTTELGRPSSAVGANESSGFSPSSTGFSPSPDLGRGPHASPPVHTDRHGSLSLRLRLGGSGAMGSRGSSTIGGPHAQRDSQIVMQQFFSLCKISSGHRLMPCGHVSDVYESTLRTMLKCFRHAMGAAGSNSGASSGAAANASTGNRAASTRTGGPVVPSTRPDAVVANTMGTGGDGGGGSSTKSSNGSSSNNGGGHATDGTNDGAASTSSGAGLTPIITSVPASATSPGAIGSLALNRDQFRALMFAEGIRNHSAADHLFSVFDAAKDGRVTFESYATLIGLLQNGDDDERTSIIFSIYDMRRCGYMTMRDVEYMLTCSQAPPNEEELVYMVQTIFAKLDVSNTGRISLAEFRAGVKKRPLLLEFFNRYFQPVTEYEEEMGGGGMEDAEDGVW
eukprot:jgi/Mesvir1/21003/Mv08061-RA.1